MGKRLIGSIPMHIKNMLSFFAAFTGAWLFGILLMSVILWTDETEMPWFSLGTAFSLLAMTGNVVLFFWKYHQEFMLSLSMGQTRREFMISYTLRQMLWMTVAYVAILLLYQLEGLYYKAMFSDTEQALGLLFLTDWRFAVPFVPGLTMVSMFLGTLYSHFGQKILVILLFAWSGSCMVILRLINHWDEQTGSLREGIGGLAAWIFAVPPVMWTIAGLLAALGMAVCTMRLGMKQMVR